MDGEARIRELEREVSRLEAELAARGDSAPKTAEDSVVSRLLANRGLLSYLPDVIAILDRDHRILYLNRVVPELRLADVIGTCVLDHLVPEERESRRKLLDRAWATGEIQTVQTRSANGYVWDNRVIPIREDGRVVCILNTAVDVTLRQRAEDALRESAAKLRHALDATGMGTWIRDASGVRWDDALCRILGVDSGTAPTDADGFFRFIHPDDRPAVAESIARSRRTGIYEETACRIVRPDGTIRHTIVKASLELDTSGQVARSYGGVFDVTDRVLLEERLRQSEKMDAVGHLTAGIAHNFNNILGVILPNVELCRRNASPQVSARLDDIMHAAERGADMVRQLMLFARREASARKEPIDVLECARRTSRICRSTFDPSLQIELSASEHLPCVMGNEGQLEQVLLNICLNARDALEEAKTAAPRIDIHIDQTASSAVRIRIADNGPGMDEETREHVFDPFFTTKDAHRGTGLGLASALAIVTDHHGIIRCHSRLDEGTTFEIELPSTTEAARAAPPSEAVPDELGTETVLLADDEPLVRNAARELLELGGYEVLEAVDGMEALAIFEQSRDRISAVILDRSMPGLSGDAVLAGLTSMAPHVPVVMLSGHLGGNQDWASAAAVLTKPTSAAVLLRAVRTVIDQARERRVRAPSS